MEFRLLGPVVVAAAGEVVDPGPPRQRLVLAALAVDASRQVTVDCLVDRVWGDCPPERARRSLHAHLSRIRHMVEQTSVMDNGAAGLVRRSGGYLLDVDPDRVDVLRFTRLVEQARGSRCADATRVVHLREALELWRGEPLAGLPGQWAGRMRDGWRRQHLDAVLAWARAELQVGNAAGVIGRLTDLAGSSRWWNRWPRC
jgi:DNA-binding SARP family transcriptional activator